MISSIVCLANTNPNTIICNLKFSIKNGSLKLCVFAKPNNKTIAVKILNINTYIIT